MLVSSFIERLVARRCRRRRLDSARWNVSTMHAVKGKLTAAVRYYYGIIAIDSGRGSYRGSSMIYVASADDCSTIHHPTRYASTIDEHFALRVRLE